MINEIAHLFQCSADLTRNDSNDQAWRDRARGPSFFWRNFFSFFFFFFPLSKRNHRRARPKGITDRLRRSTLQEEDDRQYGSSFVVASYLQFDVSRQWLSLGYHRQSQKRISYVVIPKPRGFVTSMDLRTLESRSAQMGNRYALFCNLNGSDD